MTQKNEKPLYDVSKVEEKLKNAKTLSDLTGPEGAITDMFRSTIERILKAEHDAHMGYDPYRKGDFQSENSRNGYSKKTLKTSAGEMELAIPRDRMGTFEPQIVPKHERFDPDLERKITGMYARGMSTRDIQAQLEDYYHTHVSPTLISRITDSILEGVTAWQQRPLRDVYAVIFMDAIFYKIRQDSKVISKAAYSCLGIDLEGNVDVLGMWLNESEGAHFWLSVLTDLKNRGVKDILIACVDGLKGFPEAISSAYPKTQVQLCIVHQIRNSLKFVASKYHKEFVRDLKEVYKASTLDLAEIGLLALDEKWGSRYPSAIAGWKNNWQHLSTYFDYPTEIRTMIYTTNAVEALHRQFRKVTKTKGAFPTDNALLKLIYLATLNFKGKTKQGWTQIFGQLKITFQDRIPNDVR